MALAATRKWVAIGIRLAVVLLFVLILAGVRYQRAHKDLEVWVLRDISGSTELVEKKDYPGKTAAEAPSTITCMAAVKDERKKADDKIGIISFQEQARVDAMPSTDLKLDTRGIPERGNGTDASAAIQLGAGFDVSRCHAPDPADSRWQ